MHMTRQQFILSSATISQARANDAGALDNEGSSPSLGAGIIIPPLPEKNVVQKYQMTTEFIETRRMALSVFLNRVVRLVAHTMICWTCQA